MRRRPCARARLPVLRRGIHVRGVRAGRRRLRDAARPGAAAGRGWEERWSRSRPRCRGSARPGGIAFGNGAATRYTYDARQRVTDIQTGTTLAPAGAQHLALTYDDASNVTSVTDRTTGEVAAYTYDQLSRLGGSAVFSAMTVNGVAAAFYVYDAIGNLTAKTESLPGMTNDTQLTLSYPASGAGAVQPHAVTAVSGTQSLGFQYDANGNLTGSPAQYNDPAGQPVSVTSVFNEYDAANHLVAADAGPSAGAAGGWACMDFNGDGVVSILDLSQMAASYNKAAGQPGFNARADLNWSGMVNILDLSAESAYYGKPCTAKRTRYLRDGEGALLERDDVMAGATGPVETWTVSIGGIYEVNSDGSVVTYYSAYGRSIAVRRQPAAGVAGTLSWLVADQLGTTTLALDATGAVVADARYWPYGAVRAGGVAQTDRRYTGQRQEAAQPGLGLYDYRARYYSTLMGRFVSADPVAKDGLNRYAYVLDNPLRYVDPTGHCVPDGHGGWLPCTRADQIRYFSCAWGGECDTHGLVPEDRLRAFARGAIGTYAFKFFVALESAARGDILLRLHLSAAVKGLGRKIDGYPHGDTVGNLQMFVDINATKRRVDAAYGWFDPAGGIAGYLDGWKTRREYYRVDPSGIGANLLTEAGPQGQSLFHNPFARSGFYARITWDLWFEKDGSLGQEIIFGQQGNLTTFIPIGNDIPGVDDLLVASGLSLSVTEIPQLVAE